jgi:Flp pilus assembly protein TadG
MRSHRSQVPPAGRDGQRGAAALEFALSLFFLAPLLLGMMQYGYYFYVAMNVLEAQHAGLVAASRTSGASCSAGASAAQVTARNSAKTAAAAAVTTYLSKNGLDTVVTLSGSTPTCATTPVDPTWTMTLVADFRPPLGRVMPWDKASPTAGFLRYTAQTIAMRGN